MTLTQITRITTQKKHKHRYNIFLDYNGQEEYGFSMDEDMLIKHRLQKGMELDEAMITTLKKQDDLHKSYTLAINYLSYRMRTKKEIYDYLVKKEVDEEQISTIMEHLEQEKLVNDQQFAENFVQTRIHTTSKGPRMVEQELKEKGVNTTVAEQAITSYTYEMQFDKAYHNAQKKLNQRSKHSFRQQMQKLQGHLMQKGFEQAVIKDVLAEMADQKDDEAEWEALLNQGDKVLRKYKQKWSGYTLTNKVKEALYRKGFTIEQINQFLESEVYEE